MHKPAPEYFRPACEALGDQPERVLFVDDDDRVIRGARAAGPVGVPVGRAGGTCATCGRR